MPENTWEPWIGVDLDGTLAKEMPEFNALTIGAPVPAMIEKVKKAIVDGKTVKVFTARLADEKLRAKIQALISVWTKKHVGTALESTNEKDPGMEELWDDRARGVEKNEGEFKTASNKTPIAENGWVLPNGRFVPNGRGTHLEALKEMGLFPSYATADAAGWVRVSVAGNQTAAFVETTMPMTDRLENKLVRIIKRITAPEVLAWVGEGETHQKYQWDGRQLSRYVERRTASAPLVYYRGTEPGRTERISTGNPTWDSYLFVADDPKKARNYGSYVERITLKQGSKVLREGTREFVAVAGKWRKGESLLDYAARAAEAAKAAGYDAIHFRMQGDVGTAILNRDAVAARESFDMKIASPDFEYTHYNDREQDLKNLRWKEDDYGWGNYNITAFSGKEQAGTISIASYGDKEVYVSAVEIDEDQWKGTGLGQMLYDKAITKAKRVGAVRFYAGGRNSDGLRAWERLAKRYQVMADPENNDVPYIKLATPHDQETNSDGPVGFFEPVENPHSVQPLRATAAMEDTDYYMEEGCGVYAMAVAREHPDAEIYILSRKNGEAWGSSIPYEVTHVFCRIPGEGDFDVRGKRTPDQMAADFDMVGDYDVKGPFTPKEFYTRFMGSSDNKPLYGTLRDIREVKTAAAISPELEAWFDGSRVVDRRGYPLVMYHRTAKDFDAFDTDKGDLGSHFGTAEQAENLLGGELRPGERTVPVYLKVKNPIRLKDMGGFHADSVAPQLYKMHLLDAADAKRLKKIGEEGNVEQRRAANQEIKTILKREGYDGVVYRNKQEGSGDSYIVFDPTQVKSAIGNSGAYDSTKPSITAAAKTATPNFGYSQYNDREEDLNSIIWKEVEDGTDITINAYMPRKRNPFAYVNFEAYKHNGYIGGIRLTDKWRGTGLGQILYDKAIAKAKAMGLKRLYAGARSQDAVAAWKRLAQRYPVRFEKHITEKRPYIDLTKIKTAAIPDNLKTWFGNSKVVNLKGEPLKVYHVTNQDFDTFNTEPRAVPGVHTTMDSIGAWFAGNPVLAQDVYDFYKKRRPGAPRTMPSYLRIQNPLEVQTRSDLEPNIQTKITQSSNVAEAQDFQSRLNSEDENIRVQLVKDCKKKLMELGYDGIHIHSDAKSGDSWIIFNSNQAKSAIGNTGNYSLEQNMVTATVRNGEDFRKWEDSLRGQLKDKELDASERRYIQDQLDLLLYKKKLAASYTAYVLTPEARNLVLKSFPPKFPDVIAHHVTFQLGGKEAPPPATIVVEGYASDDSLEALVVSVDGQTVRPDGEVYHITLSLDRSQGRSPKDSKEVVKAGWTPVTQPFDIQVIPQKVASGTPLLQPVSVDTLPRDVQGDIAYILHEKVDYLQQAWDADDIFQNLFGLSDEPKVMAGKLPTEKVYASFDRNFSEVAVDKYVQMLLNPHFEFDPILVVNGKFFEGGHRMEAYHRAGRKMIPVVDIANLMNASPEMWEQWMNGEDVSAAQAFPMKTAARNKWMAGGCFSFARAFKSRFGGEYVGEWHDGVYGQAIIHAAVLKDGFIYDGNGKQTEEEFKKRFNHFDTDEFDNDVLVKESDPKWTEILNKAIDQNGWRHDDYENEVESALPKEASADFNINDVKITQGSGEYNSVWYAYWKGKKIGYASLGQFGEEELAKDERCIWKSHVIPEFRRKGVATKLYDAVEEYCKAHGWKLVASPSRVLSDDAFGFWKKRNVETLKSDSRTWNAPYIGKELQYKGKTVRLQSLSDKGGVAEYLEPQESMTSWGEKTISMTTWVPSSIVFEQLGAPTKTAAGAPRDAVEAQNAESWKYLRQNPREINQGFCHSWAEEAVKRLPGAQLGLKRDEDGRLIHAYVEYNGRFYDSETPDGVSTPEELPHFQREKTGATYVPTAFYIEVPKGAREHFWEEPPAHNNEFWAYKQRPIVLKGERIIFTMDKKPVAETVCAFVEKPGESKCELTNKYENHWKVYWKPADFKKYKTAAPKSVDYLWILMDGQVKCTRGQMGGHHVFFPEYPENKERYNAGIEPRGYAQVSSGEVMVSMSPQSKEQRVPKIVMQYFKSKFPDKLIKKFEYIADDWDFSKPATDPDGGWLGKLFKKGSEGILYHVTATKNVAKIMKKGLARFQTSNWAKGSGGRYGQGEIYAMSSRWDAIRWAARMDWEFNKESGSGKISILRIKQGEEKWEIDTNDPLSQSSNEGKWLKCEQGIPPSQIMDSFPVGNDEVRAFVEHQSERFKTSSEAESGVDIKPYKEGDDDQQRYRLILKNGFGTMEAIAKPDHLKIHDVKVLEGERNKGYGKELYRAAMELAKSLGLPEIRSDYGISPDAERVWKSLNGESFTEPGASPRYRIKVAGYRNQGWITPQGKFYPLSYTTNHISVVREHGFKHYNDAYAAGWMRMSEDTSEDFHIETTQPFKEVEPVLTKFLKKTLAPGTTVFLETGEGDTFESFYWDSEKKRFIDEYSNRDFFKSGSGSGLPTYEQFVEYVKQRTIRPALYSQENYQKLMAIYQKLGDPVTLYRAITVPKGIKDVRPNEVGIYWSYDFKKARPYWPEDEDDSAVVLEASVPSSSVDWLESMYSDLMGSPGEINLKHGAPLTLTRYSNEDPMALQQGYHSEGWRPVPKARQSVTASSEAWRGAQDPIGNEDVDARREWYLGMLSQRISDAKKKILRETDPLEKERLINSVETFTILRDNMAATGTLNPFKSALLKNGADLWHGGKIYGPIEIQAPSKGRYEAGPGLYLTTSYERAYSYAKGGKSTFLVSIKDNPNWASNVQIPLKEGMEFASRYLGKGKLIAKDLKAYCERLKKDTFTADIIINLTVNYEAGSGQKGMYLLRFLVEHGVDAALEEKGSGEQWVVVFNPAIVTKVRKVPAAEVTPEMRHLPKVGSGPLAEDGWVTPDGEFHSARREGHYAKAKELGYDGYTAAYNAGLVRISGDHFTPIYGDYAISFETHKPLKECQNFIEKIMKKLRLTTKNIVLYAGSGDNFNTWYWTGRNFKPAKTAKGDYSSSREGDHSAATPKDEDYKTFEEVKAKLHFPLIVYRAFACSPERINYDGLGPYWTWDEDSARPIYAKDNGLFTVVRAVIHDRDVIDWEATFFQNVRYNWQEHELYLKNNADVEVTGLKEGDEGKWQEPHPDKKYVYASGSIESNETLTNLLEPQAGGWAGVEKEKQLSGDVSVFIDPNGSYRFVKFVDGTPVAAAQLMSRDKKTAYVSNMYVVPAFRRNGFGSELMRYARQMFKHLDFSEDRSRQGEAFVESQTKTSASYNPTILYLDDCRVPREANAHLVHNYAEFVQYMTEHKNDVPDIISFDHDIDLEHCPTWEQAEKRDDEWRVPYEDYTQPTGLDCAKWLVANNINVRGWQVHSANPVGGENIWRLMHAHWPKQEVHRPIPHANNEKTVYKGKVQNGFRVKATSAKTLAMWPDSIGKPMLPRKLTSMYLKWFSSPSTGVVIFPASYCLHADIINEVLGRRHYDITPKGYISFNLPSKTFSINCAGDVDSVTKTEAVDETIEELFDMYPELKDFEIDINVIGYQGLYTPMYAKRASMEELPPPPGTKPIPPMTVRLYHYTKSYANLANIKAQGLLSSFGRGDGGTGPSEASAGIWASTEAPADYHLFVEFYASPDQISHRANYPEGKWGHDENGTWRKAPITQADLEEWLSRGDRHVIMATDVNPSQFLAIHEPWHHHARYMLDMTDAEWNEAEWLHDPAEVEKLEKQYHSPDEAKALAYVQKVKGIFKTSSEIKTAIVSLETEEGGTADKTFTYTNLDKLWGKRIKSQQPTTLGSMTTEQGTYTMLGFGMNDEPLIVAYDPVNKVNAGYASFIRHQNNFEVDRLAFAVEYQGFGIGAKMYKWLLMKGTIPVLVSGFYQSPGGRSTWEKLAKEPGILVYGWNQKTQQAFSLDPNDLSAEEVIWSAEAETNEETGERMMLPATDEYMDMALLAIKQK